MKEWCAAISIALVAGTGSVAMAQEKQPDAAPDVGRGKQLAPKQAAEIGVEGGYTQPFGTLTTGRSISDIAKAGGGVGLTYAYRIDPHWSIGLTGQFHESEPSSDLGSGASVRGVATGIIATYHVLPFRTIDPYASLGTGYRFLWVVPRGTNNNDMIHGWELGRALGGVDFRVSKDVAMGPLVGADVNLFLWDRLQSTGTNQEITDVHPTTFVFAGVGGRFDIGGKRIPEHQHVARLRRSREPQPAAGPAVTRPVLPEASEERAQTPVTLEPSIPSACHVDSARAFFGVGSARLDTSAFASLSPVADCLATGPLRGRKVTVIGRGDAIGTDTLNASLALSRAEAVTTYLKQHGVPAADITTVSAGNRGSTGTDEGSRAFDRRVDIELSQ
jgi:outer membrane protein OmpA-like peptidoglycan-associated protein